MKVTHPTCMSRPPQQRAGACDKRRHGEALTLPSTASNRPWREAPVKPATRARQEGISAARRPPPRTARIHCPLRRRKNHFCLTISSPQPPDSRQASCQSPPAV